MAEKHKKENKDNSLIKGYKLALNGAYGKLGEETSPFYDKKTQFKVTIAGQLFICMWAERMVKVCPSLKFIQINTDGITIDIPRIDIDKIKSRKVFLDIWDQLQNCEDILYELKSENDKEAEEQ